LKKRRIGIYGGAFNPVHYGHLRTAAEVAEKLGLDRVVFIPAGRTPFDKPDLASAADRYEMVRKAIQRNNRFSISDIELGGKDRSYTIDTVRKMQDIHRNAEFSLILGTDAFIDLPSWKSPYALVKIIDLVIISRPGYPFASLHGLAYLGGVRKKDLQALDSGAMEMLRTALPGGRDLTLCRVTGMDISSTMIRSMVREGKDIRYLLPDSVKSYIISHKLYD
jgi:nicotinate-nucleotide adenylyltransferase